MSPTDILLSVRALDAGRFVELAMEHEVKVWRKDGPLARLEQRLGRDVVTAVVSGLPAPAHYQAAVPRSASLFAWSGVAEFLEHHRPSWPRLRLARDGAALSPSSFLYTVTTQRDGVVTALDGRNLVAELRQGATLIIDGMDEAVPALRAVCDDLSYVVGVLVEANAYASLRSVPGFGLHWDDHDTLIIQIAGAKDWGITAPTRQAPARGEEELVPRPGPEFDMNVRLSVGDALYVPRGWWHEATASEETSLHVTFGLPRRAVVDVWRWSTELLAKADVRLREDLRVGGNVGFAEHTTSFFSDAPGCVETLFEHYDRARALPRARVSLPWIGRDPSAWPDLNVTSLLPQPVAIIEDASAVRVFCCGLEIEIDGAASELAQQCLLSEEMPISRLASAAGVPIPTFLSGVEELLVEGLISVSAAVDAR